MCLFISTKGRRKLQNGNVELLGFNTSKRKDNLTGDYNSHHKAAILQKGNKANGVRGKTHKLTKNLKDVLFSYHLKSLNQFKGNVDVSSW